MTRRQGYSDLSLSVIESAFKDIVNNVNEKDLVEELLFLKGKYNGTLKEILDIKKMETFDLLLLKKIESKSSKEYAAISRLNKCLTLNYEARAFFDKKNFYPWIEFLAYDTDFLVNKYNELLEGATDEI